MKTLTLVLVLAALVGCKKDSDAPAVHAATAVASPAAVAEKPAERVIELTVTQKGFEPNPVNVKKGEPLVMRITRKTEATCATEVLIAGTDINVKLPMNQTVDVHYTPTTSGQVKYGCAMNMMVQGILTVE